MLAPSKVYCYLKAPRLRGLLPLAAVVIVLIAPSVARAGAYKMYTCNVPGKPVSNPTVGPWKWELDGLNTYHFDRCATNGTFGIGLNVREMRGNATARLALRRPTSGPFSRIGIVRYRTWLIAELSGTGAPAFISHGGAFSPPGGANPDAAPWVSPIYDQANGSAIVQLLCAVGNCLFASSTPLQARGIEVDLYEEAPPAASIDGGSLLAGGAQGETRSLGYAASDQESGVARVDVILGDTVVAIDDASSDPQSCPRTGFNACRGTRAGELAVNTRRVPNGMHPLRLRVTDAAGNKRIVQGPSVHVANGPDAIGNPNGTNAADAVGLTVSFAKRAARH